MTETRDIRWSALMRAANRGDRAAYAAFLAEAAPVLRGIIAARGRGRRDDVEDILQTVLMAIHEKRHTWREDEPVTAWAYAIARYKTVDAWRRRARDPARPLDDEAFEVADPLARDPSLGRDVEAVLAGLDPTSAAIVRSMRLEGAGAEETGRRHGMTAGAVRVALHRALARLSARHAGKDGE